VHTVHCHYLNLHSVLQQLDQDITIRSVHNTADLADVDHGGPALLVHMRQATLGRGRRVRQLRRLRRLWLRLPHTEFVTLGRRI
jgi:hypothetical protein